MRINLAALIVFVGCLVCAQAQAAISLVASASASGATSSGPATTSNINTTGANLFVVTLSCISASACGTLSDSASNSWTLIGSYFVGSGGGQGNIVMYYSLNPTTSSTHTFSDTGDYYGTIAVMAFSGIATSSAYDQHSVTGGTYGGTQQPGSVTPGQNGELLVSGLAYSVAGVPTINSGFGTVLNTDVNSAGMGVGMSYLVQSTAAAINPTWTDTCCQSSAAGIATFKAAAAGPTTQDVFFQGFR